MTLPSRLGSNAAFDVHADGRQTNSGRLSLPSQPSLRRRRSDAQPGSSHHLFELVDIWPSPAPSSHLRGRLDPLPLLFFFYFVQHTSFSFFTCTKKKYPLSFFFFSLAPPHVCLLLRDSILLALWGRYHCSCDCWGFSQARGAQRKRTPRRLFRQRPEGGSRPPNWANGKSHSQVI